MGEGGRQRPPRSAANNRSGLRCWCCQRCRVAHAAGPGRALAFVGPGRDRSTRSVGCAILDRRSRSYRRSTCSLRAGRCRFVISGISGIVEATWSRCLAREKPRVAPPAAPTRGSEGRHGSMMACSSASSVSWRDRPAPPHPRAPPQPGRGRLGSRHAIGAPCPDICLLSSTLERSPLRASRMRRILLPNRATARARADAGHAAPGDGASVSWLDACLGLGPDPSLPSSSSARIGPERLRRRVSAAPSTVRRGPLNQERREGPARR